MSDALPVCASLAISSSCRSTSSTRSDMRSYLRAWCWWRQHGALARRALPVPCAPRGCAPGREVVHGQLPRARQQQVQGRGWLRCDRAACAPPRAGWEVVRQSGRGVAQKSRRRLREPSGATRAAAAEELPRSKRHPPLCVCVLLSLAARRRHRSRVSSSTSPKQSQLSQQLASCQSALGSARRKHLLPPDPGPAAAAVAATATATACARPAPSRLFILKHASTSTARVQLQSSGPRLSMLAQSTPEETQHLLPPAPALLRSRSGSSSRRRNSNSGHALAGSQA